MNNRAVNLTPRRMATGRLVCVPHAGGSPASFMGWLKRIPQHVELWALGLPDQAGTDLSDVAEAAAASLAGSMNIPFALFGHSLGAWLGFEIARCLRNSGREPATLILSGRAAPAAAMRVPNIAHLPDHDFLREMQARYEGLPDSVLASNEIIEAILPSLRSDMAMLERYVYRPGLRLTCPIHVFAGRHDVNTRPGSGLEGWAAETSGPCDFSYFDGGHFYLDSDRDAFLDGLTSILENTLPRPALTRL